MSALPLLAASPAERRLLGAGRLDGPTPWVIAILMFVMVVIAAAGLALAHGARVTAAGVDQRHSVQLPGNYRQLPAAIERLRAVPGVADARPVPEAAMRATLDRWLGPAAADPDLPLPALADLTLAPGADRAAVASAVAAALPGARMTGYDEALAPITRALRALGWLALAMVVLIAGATAASVVLATRGALDTHRPTIEVMHGIGATDDQVARLFQRRIAFDSLVGGTVGAVVAGVVLVIIAAGGRSWLSELAPGPLLGPLEVLMLAALPLAGTFIAAIVARWAVMRGLGRLP